MKQYQYFKEQWISKIVSASAQCKMLKAVLVLFLLLFQVSAKAQFIKINLDIPAKAGLAEIAPLVFNTQFDSVTSKQMLIGTSVLCISGAENMQVQATLTYSDFLRSEIGDSIKMNASMAYRNDGVSELPGTNKGCFFNFPLSSCGLLIQSIKNYPVELNAYIFIRATSPLLLKSKQIYVGNIDLMLEYN